MSLKGVHLVFITASTALAAVFALWCLDEYRHGAGAFVLAAAIASFLAVGGLGVYGGWFIKTMGRIR